MNASERQWAAWIAASDAAWEKAAQTLEADGYTRRDDAYYPAVFVKDGAPDLVLTCSLGSILWGPRELGKVLP